MIYENKVSKEFADKVKQISSLLGIEPDWLMKVMYKETGGTFSPSIKNPTSSATGLIQFMAATAKSLGTTVQALAKMSAVAQLDYVYKYMKAYKPHLKSFAHTYLAVFYPAGLKKSDDWKFPNWVYLANKGLDLNKDKIVTVGEFKKWMNKGQKDSNNSGKSDGSLMPLLIFGIIAGAAYLWHS